MCDDPLSRAVGMSPGDCNHRRVHAPKERSEARQVGLLDDMKSVLIYSSSLSDHLHLSQLMY